MRGAWPAAEQGVDDVGADEPGTAGDEHNGVAAHDAHPNVHT